MTSNLEDTQPRTPLKINDYRSEVPPPPRFLLWGVLLLFALAIVGFMGGVIVFRSVLEPAQQQRVMDALPFMEGFLPPRPAAGDVLPTPASSIDTEMSPDELLAGMDLPGGNTNDASAINPQPTATPTIQPTQTALPTETALPPTLTPVPLTPTPTEAARPPDPSPEAVLNTANTQNTVTRSSARLSGFRHQRQTWNNCGPANITMALSFYGWQNDQDYADDFLKPGGREDKNVSPSEMAAFVNEQSSIRALTRMGGTLDMLKDFIANDIPVVIETGYSPEAYDWLGHYQTVLGYDDNSGVMWLYDSFLGAGENGEGISETYAYFDEHWRHFNRQFIVVYEPSREDLVRRILGDGHSDPLKAAEHALSVASDEATENPADPYAWFNIGSALVALGDYERAASAFDRAMSNELPWRFLWYQFGPYEAYYQTGRYSEVLSLVAANLSNGGEYVEETYYWQGRALAAQNDVNAAGVAFRTALRRNPRFQAAEDALNTLGL